MAATSYVNLYIITNPIVGLIQGIIWIAMGVVALRYEPESSVLIKIGRFIAGVAIAIFIGVVFLNYLSSSDSGG